MALNIKKFDKEPVGYYVYIWYRVEDHHVFYVGKGKGERARLVSSTKRNEYFLNYFNKYDSDYEIIKDNLTEHEAYVLENDLYQQYKANGECECNLADTSSCSGGPGLAGEANGMYGKTHTPEVCNLLSEINSDGRHKGANNSQYHVSPKDRMDSQTYNIWREKQHARKYGSTNPNAHPVLMVNVLTHEYLIFQATTECAKYLQDNLEDFANRYNTIEKLRYVIKHSNKTNATYFNYRFIIYNKNDPLNIENTVSSLVNRTIRFIPPYDR